MADASPTPPPEPSKKSPFAARTAKVDPPPAGPSPFASKIDRKIESTAPVLQPKAPVPQVRTIPWALVLPVVAVVLTAVVYLAYPYLENLFVGTSGAPEVAALEERRREIAQRGTPPAPQPAPAPSSSTGTPTQTARPVPTTQADALIPPEAIAAVQTDVLDLLDYLRYSALTPEDVDQANRAAANFGRTQRVLDTGGANGALKAWEYQRTTLGQYCVGLAKRRLERIASRVNDPMLGEHTPEVAPAYAGLLVQANAADAAGNPVAAVRAFEQAEQQILRAWLRLPDIILAKFEEARVANDRTAGLRYQQQIQRLRLPLATPVAAGTPAAAVTNAAPRRFVVARDPVPPGVTIWEAERIATSPSAVRTEERASGGRYATQYNAARPIVEFGFPPGLPSMTVWVRFRGREIVLESANPGNPRVEAGRTEGGAGNWEWKRVGTFERSALGSTLSLTNFEDSGWSGIDMVLVSADPAITPQ